MGTYLRTPPTLGPFFEWNNKMDDLWMWYFSGNRKISRRYDPPHIFYVENFNLLRNTFCLEVLRIWGLFHFFVVTASSLFNKYFDGKFMGKIKQLLNKSEFQNLFSFKGRKWPLYALKFILMWRSAKNVLFWLF